jgi:hypothetical protein
MYLEAPRRILPKALSVTGNIYDRAKSSSAAEIFQKN